MDCKFLLIEDITSYHGDVFDHPDYKYTCEKCRQEVIPFLHCNEERCKNYTKNQNETEISRQEGDSKMKKEIIGYVGEYNDGWFFENEKESYSSNVPTAIDELLGIDSKDGDKFKITIEKLNQETRLKAHFRRRKL